MFIVRFWTWKCYPENTPKWSNGGDGIHMLRMQKKNIPGLKDGFPNSVQSSQMFFFARACFFVVRRHRPWPKAHETFPSAHEKNTAAFRPLPERARAGQ